MAAALSPARHRSPPDSRLSAATQLKSLNRLNHPLELAYKAVDDRDVSISRSYEQIKNKLFGPES